jgi:biotin-dependent carboxylase-like uncharacterized protein
MLRTIDPGLLSTVQDAGRSGYTDAGVPIGGACDARSLAIANLLLGNDRGAAALEMTLAGPVLEATRRCVVAIAGADLGAQIVGERRRLLPGATHLLEPGTRLAFPGATSAGARGYLAVPGGIDVPLVLGSRGTCLVGGFGGLGGRALVTGDMIVPSRPSDVSLAGRRWPQLGVAPSPEDPIRLLPAPRTLSRAGPHAHVEVLGGRWTVATGDRMGIRLDGPALSIDPVRAGHLLSKGVIPGTVQVPPDGRPIVLLADAQTVGGYPVVGVVPRVDLPRLAQLREGDAVTFRPTTPSEAVAALAAQEAALVEASRRLGSEDRWISQAADMT